MKILLIGGTRFVGYALTEALLKNNHSITFFNRGKTNPDLFPEVEKIHGNRDGEIPNIGSDRKFDVVIDTCGYVPRIVKQSVDFLKDKVKYYVFISSVSVYSSTDVIQHRDELSEVFELKDPNTENIMGEPNNYGGLKVLCERTVQKVFKENAIIIRPGYIVGPNDPSHRFTYWPVRIRKAGKMLAPGDSPCNLQIVDVRDLAEFIVELVEKQKTGVFNVAGPEEPFDFREMLEKLHKITSSNAEIYWATNSWLQEQGVIAGKDFPIWDPSVEDQTLMNVNIDKALKAGLKFRSLDDTVNSTLQWYDDIKGETKEWSVGLNSEKEKELLIHLRDK